MANDCVAHRLGAAARLRTVCGLQDSGRRRGADLGGEDKSVEWSVPAERQEVRKQVSDPIVAKRTRDYYRNLGKVQITGWAKCYLEPIPSIA